MSLLDNNLKLLVRQITVYLSGIVLMENWQ